MSRVHNFSAGPAVLPLEVLKKAQSELLDYMGKGSSIMEVSHRGAEFVDIHKQAVERLKRILKVGDDWNVLFLAGGASTQFTMLAQNFLNKELTADYINTGAWSKKAIKEAEIIGNVHIPYSGEEKNFTRIPENSELNLSDDAAYLHFTSNNTIFGTQFRKEPESNGVPLVCDASSDFLSRPIDMDRYGMIYAGAQKNLGPAGVTIVLIHNNFLEKQVSGTIPTILNYQTHLDKMFNTPPVFPIYMVNYVLEWIEQKGGLSYFEKFNEEKAGLLYDEIDRDEFYKGTAENNSRSTMNVTFRLQNEELESSFLKEAATHNLVTLKGHRSVGGIRASIYNACPRESVEALVQFMKEFRSANS